MSLLWVKFAGWCKKQWKLIAGFFLGIIAILAVFRRGMDKKTLEQKNKMNDDVLGAEREAKEELEQQYQDNLQTFLDRNDKIEEKAKAKLTSLKGEKKKRVKELLESDEPEAAIAAALSDLLN